MRGQKGAGGGGGVPHDAHAAAGGGGGQESSWIRAQRKATARTDEAQKPSCGAPHSLTGHTDDEQGACLPMRAGCHAGGGPRGLPCDAAHSACTLCMK